MQPVPFRQWLADHAPNIFWWAWMPPLGPPQGCYHSKCGDVTSPGKVCHADEAILQRRIIVHFLHNDLARLSCRVEHDETQNSRKRDSLRPNEAHDHFNMNISGSDSGLTLVSFNASWINIVLALDSRNNCSFANPSGVAACEKYCAWPCTKSLKAKRVAVPGRILMPQFSTACRVLIALIECGLSACTIQAAWKAHSMQCIYNNYAQLRSGCILGSCYRRYARDHDTFNRNGLILLLLRHKNQCRHFAGRSVSSNLASFEVLVCHEFDFVWNVCAHVCAGSLSLSNDYLRPFQLLKYSR